MSVSNDGRIVEIRNSLNIDQTILDFPFLFIQGQFGYSVDSIQRRIHSETLINLGIYPDTFPNTIIDFNWIKSEQIGHSGKRWFALGRLKGDLFFFYTAYCVNDISFIGKNNQMNLWVSRRYSDLIHNAMNLETYKIYIDETVAPSIPEITELEDQTDAKSQMSRQALDALILSGAFEPPIPSEISPSDQ